MLGSGMDSKLVRIKEEVIGYRTTCLLSPKMVYSVRVALLVHFGLCTN